MDFIHLVLSLLAVVPARLKYNPDYQCSMSREIHHLQLKFASFLCLFLNCGWTFGESNSNKSFQIFWISETKRLVSNLRLWSPILSPQIRQSEAKCWKWIFINTLKRLIPWKKKRQRLVSMGKKVITLALPCMRETLEWNTCFDRAIQRLSTKIQGCLPSTHSTWERQSIWQSRKNN